MQTDDVMLEHHLQNNHFPPYDKRLVPYCQIAIEKAEAGDWDTEITIKGDAGELTVTVARIVEDFHLHDFITAHNEQP